MRKSEVSQFLTHLAVNGNVSASTQNVALNALVFMYRHVFEQPLNEINGIVRAKKPKRLPVVLTREEVAQILSKLQGRHWLIACLQYGSGFRLIESVRLRVQDLDFDHQALYIRSGNTCFRLPSEVSTLVLVLRGAITLMRAVLEKQLSMLLELLILLTRQPNRLSSGLQECP
jgi:integrase